MRTVGAIKHNTAGVPPPLATRLLTYPCRMTLQVSWQQALAWRMKRQLLDPVGTLAVEEAISLT